MAHPKLKGSWGAKSKLRGVLGSQNRSSGSAWGRSGGALGWFGRDLGWSGEGVGRISGSFCFLILDWKKYETLSKISLALIRKIPVPNSLRFA